MLDSNNLFFFGFVLLLSGILIIAVASFLQINADKKFGRIDSVGVIMIGPIPLVFGNFKLIAPLMVLAVVLMAVYFFLFLK